MTDSEGKFAGRWLSHGERLGTEFSHEKPDFENEGNPDDSGATPMRHAVIDRDGSKVGVWVPADWTDDQAREALEENW
tara:strand:+ start:687 stop:920 length:234 start_codon:yes stop_codon:yes gene_type:complete